MKFLRLSDIKIGLNKWQIHTYIMESRKINIFYFINQELTKMGGYLKHFHLFKIMNSSKFIRIFRRSLVMMFNKMQFLWQENTTRAIKDLLNFFCAYVQIFKT